MQVNELKLTCVATYVQDQHQIHGAAFWGGIPLFHGFSPIFSQCFFSMCEDPASKLSSRTRTTSSHVLVVILPFVFGLLKSERVICICGKVGMPRKS